MKRVNLKLLLALVAAAVIAVVGVTFLRRFQINRNAGGLAKLARQKLEEGKPAEALVLFQRYVGLRPEDKQAFGEYAELVLRKTEGPEATRADLTRAYSVLEEAIRRDPTNDGLRAKLAQFQLRIGRFADAREHLSVLREHIADGTLAPPPASTETADDEDPAREKLTAPDTIALMLARASLGMGDFEQAAAIAGELVGFDLESQAFGVEARTGAATDAYVLLAAILEEKMRATAAATAVLEQLVKARPDDATAWLARSRWHRQRNDAAAAARDLDKALELAPDNPEVLFAAFDLCIGTGDAARAEKLARQGREAFPGDERAYRALATVCLQQGRTEEAEQVLRDGVAALPTRASLLLMMADVQLQRGEVAEAEQTIARVKEVFGQASPAVGLFEARILIGRQRWSQARDRLREVRPLVAGIDDLTRQVDLYLGQCAEQLGEFDEQLAAHQRVLSESPTLLPARVGAASALMAAGKNDEALAEYEAVAAGVPADKLPGIPQIWLPLLQLRVAAQARRPPEKRDWSTIDALLESLQQAAEVSASQMALLRADVLMRKGELDAAATLLAKASAAEPANPQLAAARVGLALRREGAAAARGLIDDLPAEAADHPAVLSVDAQVAAAAGGDAAL